MMATGNASNYTNENMEEYFKTVQKKLFDITFKLTDRKAGLMSKEAQLFHNEEKFALKEKTQKELALQLQKQALQLQEQALQLKEQQEEMKRHGESLAKVHKTLEVKENLLKIGIHEFNLALQRSLSENFQASAFQQTKQACQKTIQTEIQHNADKSVEKLNSLLAVLKVKEKL